MKLSHMLESEITSSLVYGVVVDAECLTAPAEIRTIGFLYQGGDLGLSEKLMDAIITFSLAGAEVILEIPHDAELDVDQILRLASNAGFSISLIPPSSQEHVENWGHLCARFTEGFLKTPNFSKHVFPVQGYFAYVIAEKLGAIDAITPTDPYVVERFLDSTPQKWSDAAKLQMRGRMVEICGSEEEIDALARDLVSAIGQEVVKIAEGDGVTSPNA